MGDLVQCRQAELEFVSSAYMEDEVWWEYENEKNAIARIFRRLEKQVNVDGKGGTNFSLILELLMPPNYPLEEPLEVNGKVDEMKADKKLLKQAYDILPSLISCCRETAESMLGTEAVFSVFSAADDFMNDLLESEAFLQKPVIVGEESCSINDTNNKATATTIPVLLGRRLIYSHHIISRKKRADLKRLFTEYNLTGYVKIGWPGLIIIEGRENACLDFYDVIRRWAWQYLVVRGEMQEEIEDGSDLESQRLFSKFIEVQDMSIVAGHCREVGLEALFCTSMKQYGNDEPNDCPDQDDDLYGALIHVDHFNDSKSCGKWLSKTSNQLGIGLLVKECYHSLGPENTKGEGSNVICNGRPLIVVALIGDSSSVSSMLKKWRTTRVDVDSRGKPCLERRMKVLAEQRLERRRSIDRLDWDSLAANDQKAVTKEQLVPIIESIGGETWVRALEDLFSLS